MTAKRIWTLVAATGLVLACGPTARAQYNQVPRPGINPSYNLRPAWSPYLNLLRPDASVTQNYFGLVRPELEFRRQSQFLSQGIEDNRQAINSLNNAMNSGPGQQSGLGPTGHNATFLNTGKYFMNSGAGNAGSFGTGAGGNAMARAGGKAGGAAAAMNQQTTRPPRGVRH